MAKRRMISTDVLYTDDFTLLPFSVRALYVYLNLAADDDGFISSALQITRSCGATSEDFQMLLDTGYIMQISPNLYLVRHWRLQNQIRKDRYTPTIYQNELKSLLLINKIYYFPEEQPGIPDGYQAGYQTGPQISKDKNSLDKNKRFVPPTVEEVRAYCQERKNNVDPERFVDFYSSKGWMIGKNKMKDFKAAVRTWEKKEEPKKSKNGFEGRSYDFKELEREAFKE